MAERRRSNGSSKESSSSSPGTAAATVCRIPDDHIFSILLRLPIDSILCFGMTCRRLRSLTYSDALWESICRRDWGSSSVDDLIKAHDPSIPIAWQNLYQQLHQLDSVYCRRLLAAAAPATPPAPDMVPSPRASHSLNFVSGCLLLFGGGCEGGLSLSFFKMKGKRKLNSLVFLLSISFFCPISFPLFFFFFFFGYV
ncbi:unnamed protein product [Coffea canephora]|uniref:F-box domain-containing protein n=1 Tax=Coffea canephora TaxID=49390 RepID=A0A068TNG6_COFCA|nr:unnamed protein product [Coffea canephora]